MFYPVSIHLESVVTYCIIFHRPSNALDKQAIANASLIIIDRYFNITREHLHDSNVPKVLDRSANYICNA